MASSQVVNRTVYRALLRQAKNLCRGDNNNKVLWSSVPLNRWGKYQFGDSQEGQTENLFGLNDDILTNDIIDAIHNKRILWPKSPVIDKDDLLDKFKTSCRMLSRDNNDDDDENNNSLQLDLGFDFLKVFQILNDTKSFSNVNEMDGVRIACKSQWVQRQQDGSDTFVYRLFVENVGTDRVQLLGRHWVY